jgi:hypothetical protein
MAGPLSEKDKIRNLFRDNSLVFDELLAALSNNRWAAHDNSISVK